MALVNDFVRNTVIKPGLQRLGTVGATLLLAGGDKLCAMFAATCGMVTAQGAALVMTWVSAAALIAFDLVVIHFTRRS